MTPLTWKSHESAGSLVEVERRGQSSAGLPVVFSSSCQTGLVTLGTTERTDEQETQGKRCKSVQCNPWGKCTEQSHHSTHHNHSSKRWASSSECQKSNSPASEHSSLEAFWTLRPVNDKFHQLQGNIKKVAHILRVIAYLLLRRNTAGLSHTLNASEKLEEK